MKTGGDDWVQPADETDGLPDALKADARRRRAIVRIGTPIAVVFVLLAFALLDGGAWLAKVWLYGSTYQQLWGPK